MSSHYFKSKRLLLLRFYYQLSCQEIADKTGLSKQAISKFETGELKPSEVTMLGLCNMFNLPDDFFTRDELIIKCVGDKIIIQEGQKPLKINIKQRRTDPCPVCHSHPNHCKCQKITF